MLILIKRMSDHPSPNLLSPETSQTSPIMDIVAAVDATNVNSNKEIQHLQVSVLMGLIMLKILKMITPSVQRKESSPPKCGMNLK